MISVMHFGLSGDLVMVAAADMGHSLLPFTPLLHLRPILFHLHLPKSQLSTCTQ